jgi:hypothetical protein
VGEASLLYLELLSIIYRKPRFTDLDIWVVSIELTLEELSMLGLHLEKKPNPSVLMDYEKPKNRSLVPPVEKPNMPIMERIMERREHLTSDKDSLLVRTIYSNFESDEGRGRQVIIKN